MRALLGPLVVLFMSAGAQSASAAACLTQGDPRAAPIATDDAAISAPIMVHLSLWLTMMADRDFEAQMAKVAAGCDRVGFKAGRRDYTLSGENSDQALPRVATTPTARAPIAYLTPVTDFTTAMTPGHSGPAPISGYALLTALSGEHTAWRIYDHVPPDETLARDMADALAQKIRPLMRWRDGKVEIIVPGG
ncbi:MAG: hypothetical protein Q7S93_06980 [Phenylobacterium sp.]|uniref:hypothetical protein n=1 Tax=Phenylobacterium sp. TaxID=1871053 RepID=UPI0027191DEE|nr:hypothetical protein [Phenylobacterium sp.]MDO8409788.1 hypothetical protein [Phenylobacterium sp.]